VFIDPGSPWQNAWIESFNGRLRDELLNGWQFDSLLEAQVLIEDWRIDYNTNRPHTAHGDITPSEFAQAWTTRHQPALAERLDHSSGPAQTIRSSAGRRSASLSLARRTAISHVIGFTSSPRRRAMGRYRWASRHS
jgi:hypothetical protein